MNVELSDDAWRQVLRHLPAPRDVDAFAAASRRCLRIARTHRVHAAMAAASRPGRISDEPLPTPAELWSGGTARVSYRNVRATLEADSAWQATLGRSQATVLRRLYAALDPPRVKRRGLAVFMGRRKPAAAKPYEELRWSGYVDPKTVQSGEGLVLERNYRGWSYYEGQMEGGVPHGAGHRTGCGRDKGIVVHEGTFAQGHWVSGVVRAPGVVLRRASGSRSILDQFVGPLGSIVCQRGSTNELLLIESWRVAKPLTGDDLHRGVKGRRLAALNSAGPCNIVWPNGWHFEGRAAFVASLYVENVNPEWNVYDWYGQGELRSPDGVLFEGGFSNRKALEYSSHHRYSRDAFDRFSPDTCVVRWPKGHIFRGSIRYSCGEGNLTLADGRALTIPFRRSDTKQPARLTWPCGAQLEADEADDQPTGPATLITRADLQLCTGTLVRQQWAGEAVVKWRGETEYVGRLHHDRLHGPGFMSWGNGQTFSGQWLDDAMLLGLLVPSPASTWTGWVYDGPLHANLPHGRGKVRRLADGEEWETPWQRGVPAAPELAAHGPLVPTPVPDTCKLRLDKTLPDLLFLLLL